MDCVVGEVFEVFGEVAEEGDSVSGDVVPEADVGLEEGDYLAVLLLAEAHGLREDGVHEYVQIASEVLGDGLAVEGLVKSGELLEFIAVAHQHLSGEHQLVSVCALHGTRVGVAVAMQRSQPLRRDLYFL